MRLRGARHGRYKIPNALLEAFASNRMAPWTYAKPRFHALIASLTGREHTIADMPNGHWGRHALDYWTRKLKLRSKLQPQKRFFHETTYTGELMQPTAFEHLVEDDEIAGLHLFAKRIQSDFPEGSFALWAQQRVAGELA